MKNESCLQFGKARAPAVLLLAERDSEEESRGTAARRKIDDGSFHREISFNKQTLMQRRETRDINNIIIRQRRTTMTPALILPATRSTSASRLLARAAAGRTNKWPAAVRAFRASAIQLGGATPPLPPFARSPPRAAPVRTVVSDDAYVAVIIDFIKDVVVFSCVRYQLCF